VSIDGGESWTRFKANLPTVAVHDLTIHPRENDLVLGTYGRGFWVGDISPLQDLTADTFDKHLYLFNIEPRARYGFSTQGMNYHLFGDKYIEVPNEPDAMAINFWLKNSAGASRVTIADISGRIVAQLGGETRAGLNRVLWNMLAAGAAAPTGRGGRGSPSTIAPPGDYVVTVEVGGEKQTKIGRVRERIW